MLTLTRVRGIDSCALDVAERGQSGNQAIGDAVGRHRTLVAREIRGAVTKACAAAERIGVDSEDFVGALLGMSKAENDNG
jgi:hypothetical protein